MAKKKTILKPEEALQIAEAEKCKQSFKHFFFAAWKHMATPEPLIWNWHLSVLCDHLQHLFFGWLGKEPQIIQNLLINVPPGSLKTYITSVAFPAWTWLHEPKFQLLTLSANPRRSLESAALSKNLINSEWYRKTFNIQWEMSEDTDSKGYFRNTQGGKRISIAMGSTIIGDRGDIIILDDPQSASEIDSENYRLSSKQNYNLSIHNRVNDLRKSLRVCIMQRLHQDDMSQLFIDLNWHHLFIEQKCERHCSTPYWIDTRQVGELMFPTRFTEEVLKAERKTQGSAGYSAQHQQNPVDQEGNLFKKDWFQNFTEEQDSYILHHIRLGSILIPKSDCQKILIADTASSVKQYADYTVLMLLSIHKTGYVLCLDVIRVKQENPDVEKLVEQIYQTQRPLFLALEEKNTGIALVQSLRRKPIALRPLKAIGDKRTRSLKARLAFENLKWFFRKDAQWVETLKDELLAFDKGSHDDQVDCISYGQLEAENLTLGNPDEPLPFSVNTYQEKTTIKPLNPVIDTSEKAEKQRFDRIYNNPAAWR